MYVAWDYKSSVCLQEDSHWSVEVMYTARITKSKSLDGRGLMYRMLFLIGPVWLYPNLTIYGFFFFFAKWYINNEQFKN